MIVLRQHLTILLAVTIMSCLSTVLHLLLMIEDDFEDDVSRYINEQIKSNTVSSNLKARQEETKSHPTYARNTTSAHGHEFDSMKQIHLKQNKSGPEATNKTVTDSGIASAPNIKETTSHQQPNRQQLDESHTVTKTYWNLSCPLELTMFSGAHMGGEYLARAEKARAVAEEALGKLEDIDWKLLQNRRIFFIGDSLLRQVFISMACLSWDRVTNYAIPWFEKRGVRMRQPNTFGSGPHSKFEEGRILLQGNIELIYHHGIGGLLELGDEYEAHDPTTWLKSCFMKKPFTTFTPKLPTDHQQQLKLSTVSVLRDQVTVSDADMVLINASVHAARSFNLNNILDLFRCKSFMKYPNRLWPTFLYIATGPSHFPTETGAFEKELLELDEEYNCRVVSSFHGYQDDEVKKLDGYLPIIGRDLLPFEYESGDLHVGGKDCLHWFQPGIPDLVSRRAMDAIISTIQGTEQQQL